MDKRIARINHPSIVGDMNSVAAFTTALGIVTTLGKQSKKETKTVELTRNQLIDKCFDFVVRRGGRNALCTCRSGRKFKVCCLKKLQTVGLDPNAVLETMGIGFSKHTVIIKE